MRITVALTCLVVLACGVAPVAAQTTGVREVTASEHSVIALQTRLRFTTMVILPEGEDILDVVCGDRDFWVISAAQNIAHVKPAKEGASSNMNLITAKGTVYSFLLAETKGGQADLKVYVAADPEQRQTPAKFVPVAQMMAEVHALESQLKESRTAVDAAQRRSEQAISDFKQQYPASLQFVYGMPKYMKPFLVRSIWHDGRFTYIRTDARELPVLYEVKDGQPSLVDFRVQGTTYVIPKVIDQGYLALGKQRFPFGLER